MIDDHRPAGTEAPVAQPETDPEPRPRQPGIIILGRWVQVLGVLAVFGAVFAAITLFAHRTGCYADICGPGSRHDLTGVGWAVLFGGVVQGLVICCIGTTAVAVGELRHTAFADRR